MVTRYGMSEKLGNVAYDRDPRTFLTRPNLPSPPHEREYAENTAATVDKEVRANVEKAFQRAPELLRQRRTVLDRTARRLLETETLEETELMWSMIQRRKPLPRISRTLRPAEAGAIFSN